MTDEMQALFGDSGTRRSGRPSPSLLHAAQKYRDEAREAFLEAKGETDHGKRRALILRMQRLTRMAVDLEKKAGRTTTTSQRSNP